MARSILYPEIEPYDSGWLKVSDIHQIYYEQCGKPDGNPVVFLHGGPGVGTFPRDRQYFDPDVYRIILLDQRGAGKSLPAGELAENTTWDVVEDLEKLRCHLSVEKWVVHGHSWGSMLALTYAETHPESIKALIVAGIFTGRREEVMWFSELGGASRFFPDRWEEFLEFIPKAEHFNLLNAYYRRLTGEDETVKRQAARLWCRLELSMSKLIIDEEFVKYADLEDLPLNISRIECHYFTHGLFLKSDSQILDNVDKIRHIPTTIIQGRYDFMCPLQTGWDLHRRFPEADFHLVPDSGHADREPGIESRLVQAAEKYKHL